MRRFFAAFLGSLAALAVFTSAFLGLGVLLVFALGHAGKQAVVDTVDKGSWLVLNLDEIQLADAPPPVESSGLSAFFSGREPFQMSLRSILDSLQDAAGDRNIAGLLITGSLRREGYGAGFASIEELRNKLSYFKSQGKPIHAYFNQASVYEYYLTSMANDWAINPFGDLEMPGLASQPMFYADGLKKFGIGVQVTRSGKYKGAVEPYIRNDLSPENRYQLQTLLNGIWTHVLEGIAKDRGVSALDVLGWVNSYGIITAEKAKDLGLVDRMAYRDEILAELQNSTGQNKDEPFLQIDLKHYYKIREANRSSRFSKGSIAVVYAEGEIVDGEGADDQVGGVSFSRQLRAIRNDDTIDAVVLRVNSPGGSAFAAEEILRELQLISQDKPVIISMGNYAASGGYWISTAGEHIFAEDSTITGSIGVFGLQMDVEKLGNNLGITWDSVKTSQYADMLTVARPKTEAEMHIFQDMVDWTYQEFLKRVSKARNMDIEHTHGLAQGRVWLGSDALQVGLVDEIGGLQNAIDYAAKKAGVSGDYDIVEYPYTQTFEEYMKSYFADSAPQETSVSALQQVFADVMDEMKNLKTYNDPRGIYARLPIKLIKSN